MRNERNCYRPLELAPELLQAFQTAFINRTDCYHLQRANGEYTYVKKPLTHSLITTHLKGAVTLGAYALDADSKAKWLCLDADTDERFGMLVDLAKQLEPENITSYLEQSRRGGHLWLFTPRMSGKDIRRFGKQLMSEYHLPDDMELYPRQDRVLTTGSLVRLPFGVHRITGRRYHFITPEGEPLAPTIREQITLLGSPLCVPQGFFEQVLALSPEPEVVSPTLAFDNLKRGSGKTLSEILKATVSVEDFVRQFIDLDARGKGYCPFHDDRKKSFSVNLKHNYWHCFAGCKGQTIIDFWMLWRSMHGQDGSFTASITELRGILL